MARGLGGLLETHAGATFMSNVEVMQSDYFAGQKGVAH